MGSFVWYSVEFVANIAVILYVLSKLGYISSPRLVKQDVPATLADQVKETATFVKTMGEVLGSMKSMLPSSSTPSIPPK
uniref:Uncharacterized protein n=1 Tax=viral metagenome TaxID=1070528 RepID=A0A6C0CFU9_9ZZZZ